MIRRSENGNALWAMLRAHLLASVVVLTCLLVGASAQAQVPAVLTREAFVRLVLENHPVARQAALRTELGEATVRSARGGLDPVATANYDAKQFDEKN